MAVTTDIVRTFVAPRRVIRDQLQRPRHEGRALALLMLACLLVFVGQWPRLAREAFESGRDVDMLIGGALLGWIFIAPLALYLLAGLVHLVARLLGGQGDGYGARLALFWSLLAASPLWLLHGLVAGLVGPGPGLFLVGLIALVTFAAFWLLALVEVERGEARSA